MRLSGKRKGNNRAKERQGRKYKVGQTEEKKREEPIEGRDINTGRE